MSWMRKCRRLCMCYFCKSLSHFGDITACAVSHCVFFRKKGEVLFYLNTYQVEQWLISSTSKIPLLKAEVNERKGHTLFLLCWNVDGGGSGLKRILFSVYKTVLFSNLFHASNRSRMVVVISESVVASWLKYRNKLNAIHLIASSKNNFIST